MKQTQRLIILVCILSMQTVFSAIPNQKNVPMFEARTVTEKLTGFRQIMPKKKSEKALMMARESRDQKNYILAIKRYNYIIKNFSQSKEATLALLDKSAIYQKMGFEKPAIYNLNKARLISKTLKTSGQVVK